MESVCVLRRGCAACIDKKHLIDKTVLGSFLEYGISFLWGGSYPHRLSKSVNRSFVMSALHLDTSINVLLNNFYLWQIFIVKCFKKPLLFRISNLFPKPHEICRLKKKTNKLHLWSLSQIRFVDDIFSFHESVINVVDVEKSPCFGIFNPIFSKTIDIFTSKYSSLITIYDKNAEHASSQYANLLGLLDDKRSRKEMKNGQEKSKGQDLSQIAKICCFEAKRITFCCERNPIDRFINKIVVNSIAEPENSRSLHLQILKVVRFWNKNNFYLKIFLGHINA